MFRFSFLVVTLNCKRVLELRHFSQDFVSFTCFIGCNIRFNFEYSVDKP